MAKNFNTKINPHKSNNCYDCTNNPTKFIVLEHWFRIQLCDKCSVSLSDQSIYVSKEEFHRILRTDILI